MPNETQVTNGRLTTSISQTIKTSYTSPTRLVTINQDNTTPSCIDTCDCTFSHSKISDLNDIISDIKVDKKNTTSYWRTKRSASDDQRTSSKVIGWIGALIYVLPFGMSILIDMCKTKTKRGHLKQQSKKNKP